MDQTQGPGAYPRYPPFSNKGTFLLMQRRCSSFAHLLHVRQEPNALRELSLSGELYFEMGVWRRVPGSCQ